jgi:hypothetical protein
VLFRSVCLLALIGCQGKAEPPAPVAPVMIEVHDGTQVTASVRTGRPCRATIGPIELIVGGPPLVSQLGETKWTGSNTPEGGTFLLRNDDRVVRVYPVGDPASAGVYDLQGVALLRVAATGDRATVTDAAGRPLRTLTRTGTEIAVDAPKVLVTGTPDLVLAALISSPEIGPEVRMLAACERVLVAQQKPGA